MYEFDVLDPAKRILLREVAAVSGCTYEAVRGWVYRGVRSVNGEVVKLPTRILAGKRYTSMEALREFVARQNGVNPAERREPIAAA